MSRRLWTSIITVVASAGVVLLVALLALQPSPAPAQSPPAPPKEPASPPSPSGAAPAQTPTPSASQPATASEPMPSGYMGVEVCKACHAEQFEKFAHTKMGRLFLLQPRNAGERLACEKCHGPGKAHVEAGGGKGVGGMISFAKNDPTPIETRNQMCLTCHTKGARVFWKGSAHDARDIACTSCHVVMEDRSSRSQLAKATEIETCGNCHLQKRASTMRTSHMPLREGKMTCSSCHNPHGTVTPALLKETSLNDTCYRCHAEKRGPFLWVHAPVPESCANCHDPHGSNNDNMLRIAKPRLCQQCHIESRHPTNPYGRDNASQKFVLGRSCVSCHANIHGSNHPGGHAFTR
jgi:DmsE family decaheme c-type cytochrome